MKKNKGFTLIELLAVIVILAVIALIAVPVIMNIITQAKKSAFKDTAYGIINAGELYYADKALNVNGMTEDVTIILPDADNILNLKGEMPNGIVKINKNGNVALAVTNGKYCITKYYDDTDISIRDSIVDCEVPSYPFLELATTSNRLGVTEVDKCAKEGICEVGTAFAIKVNDTETYKFYVVSDDGDKVTLIMSENIGTSPWITSSDYGESCSWKPYVGSTTTVSFNPCVYKGPITLLNNLDLVTSGWTNIPKRNYTYSGENYSNVNVNMRASIVSLSEVSTLTRHYGSAIPEYLSEIFWTTSHVGTASIGSAPPTIGLYWNGSSTSSETITTPYGIRPAITLDKKNLFVFVNDVEIAEKVEIHKNSTHQISAVIVPSNATNGTLVYKSSDTSVATVAESGLITGIGKGTATITATTIDGSNISKTMVVEVKQPVENLDLGTTTLSMVIGATYQVEPVITPDDSFDKTLNYSSSDSSIVTVSETGLITGVSGGTATVTVSTTDGSNISQIINVTVRQLVESVTFSKTSMKGYLGSTYELQATVLPSTATNKVLNWSSADESVVAVDQNGNITGLSVGATTITATTTDGTNISGFLYVTINEPIMTSEHTCVTSGTCTAEEINAGILVNVKVNASQSYNFYVTADTGSELTLIMDRNIGTPVAWYKDNDDTTNNELNNLGPITVLNYLNSETSTWTNIEPITSYQYDNNLNGTTNQYGYQKLVIIAGTGFLTSQVGTQTMLTGTSRARLLTFDEANALYTANSNVPPTWLYTNLSSASTTTAPFGYWFLTAYPSLSKSGRYMPYYGDFMSYSNVYSEDIRGARPVITISK